MAKLSGEIDISKYIEEFEELREIVLDKKIEELQKIIDESNNIVAFTGAGISTESGLKDFRSKDGLYKQKNKYDLPPEYLLSSDCFYNNTDIFYEYYKENLNVEGIKPNIAHNYLKHLEDINKLKAVITQNIDGLHTNKVVYEVHGTISKNKCIKCGKEYDKDTVFKSNDIPMCSCGGLIKPKVVLYGESLPEYEVNKSIESILNADTLLVLGSSLTVYPAAGFINYFKGKNLVIINLDSTPFDDRATLVINDKLSNVFSKLK